MTEQSVSGNGLSSMPLPDIAEGVPFTIDDYIFLEMSRRTVGIVPSFMISLVGVIIFSKIQGFPRQFVISTALFVGVLGIRWATAYLAPRYYPANRTLCRVLHSVTAYLLGFSLGIIAVLTIGWFEGHSFSVMALFVLFSASFGSLLSMSLDTGMFRWFNIVLLMPAFLFFLAKGTQKGVLVACCIAAVFFVVISISKKHKEWFMKTLDRSMEFRLNYRQLEKIINERTSEQRRLEKELMEIGERERRKIGSDLHDDLGQHLVGIEAICSMVRNRIEHQPFQEKQLIETMHALMKEAIRKTRRIAKGLCPVDLEENGLEPALTELVRTVETTSRIPCRMSFKGRVPHMGHYQSVNLYHIVQEALNNAARHSRATRIGVDIVATGTSIIASVEDNGIGLIRNGSITGLGLRILRYRAGLIGGEIDMVSTPGKGTKIICVLNGIS